MVGVGVASYATSLVVYVRPYLIECIMSALVLALAAFSLQVKNLILGCALLLGICVLVIVGAAKPSKSRCVMLLYVLLCFTASAADEAKAAIAELYSILLAATDIGAVATLASLLSSEAVTISYARAPLIVTGCAALPCALLLVSCHHCIIA